MQTVVIELESLAHALRPLARGNDMSQDSNKTRDPMVDEYDFSGGVRGKYVNPFPKGNKVVVVLEPDVAEIFKDSESVNRALRDLAAIIQRQSEKAHR